MSLQKNILKLQKNVLEQLLKSAQIQLANFNDVSLKIVVKIQSENKKTYPIKLKNLVSI